MSKILNSVADFVTPKTADDKVALYVTPVLYLPYRAAKLGVQSLIDAAAPMVAEMASKKPGKPAKKGGEEQAAA